MNTGQIEVFKELKEHFWREDVIYQTIKTKERLCHSCNLRAIVQVSRITHFRTTARPARQWVVHIPHDMKWASGREGEQKNSLAAAAS